MIVLLILAFYLGAGVPVVRRWAPGIEAELDAHPSNGGGDLAAFGFFCLIFWVFWGPVKVFQLVGKLFAKLAG